jgi:nucleoid DNA-binding protein
VTESVPPLPPIRPTFTNLITEVAIDVRLTKLTTRRVLETFFAQLAEATWATGRVYVPGLGLFAVRSRRRRRITNPQTNRPLMLPGHRAVYARVAKSWRRQP